MNVKWTADHSYGLSNESYYKRH